MTPNSMGTCMQSIGEKFPCQTGLWKANEAETAALIISCMLLPGNPKPSVQQCVAGGDSTYQN